MCGIAGFVGRDLKGSAEEMARVFCSSLEHRGPDAASHFYDGEGQALLAHTRLSIIDLSDKASQPMTFDRRHYLIYNGEIYNHRELRADLEKEGQRFESSSDTEVVLRLLIHRGQGALSLLQGMFALALWDREKRTLLLARDPFGMKPLHVAENAGTLAFSSEMRALLQTGLVKPRLRPEGLSEYLRWGCNSRKESLVEGIQPLPPGEAWEWKDGKINKHSFGQIPIVFRENNATPEDFRTAWLDSVEHHFVSDVPLGLFLSGGADSSSILAAAAARGHKPSAALTLHFGKDISGENREAAQLAAYFGIPHIAHALEPEEINPLFHEHLKAQDWPSMDGFNIYCVSHAARSFGLKVMLTGLGGDELLGGYPSFTRIPRVMSILRALPGGIRSGPGWDRFVRLLGSTRLARMAEWAGGPPTWPHAYSCYRGIFPRASISMMLGHWGVSPAAAPANDFVPTGPEWTDGKNQIARLEFRQYLQQQLLGDGDACSMAHGLELRHPFLDEVLWRTGASLPSSIRFDTHKRILKKCLPELPDEIFERPKMGFSLPYEAWFEGPLKEFESLIPGDLSAYAQTWYQKTALIALFSWMKRHHITL